MSLQEKYEQFFSIPFQAAVACIEQELSPFYGYDWPKCPWPSPRPGEWTYRQNPLTKRGVWRNNYTGRVRGHREAA